MVKTKKFKKIVENQKKIKASEKKFAQKVRRTMKIHKKKIKQKPQIRK